MPISDQPKKRILVVDNERSIRETMAMLLVSAGYDVTIAKDGFSALLQLKRDVPELILSDLNMPQMSGFEFLSVVRRRFPQILVVAMSGAFAAGDAIPGGVIADAFYAKGSDTPESLLRIISALFEISASQINAHAMQSAPVWIPRNGNDSNGIPYVVVTCTECLRSFPLNVASEVTGRVLETPCIFCLNEVRYIIDFSLSVASPKKQVESVVSIGRTASESG